jgi:hypothetical protein
MFFLPVQKEPKKTLPIAIGTGCQSIYSPIAGSSIVEHECKVHCASDFQQWTPSTWFPNFTLEQVERRNRFMVMEHRVDRWLYELPNVNSTFESDTFFALGVSSKVGDNNNRGEREE